MVSAQPIEPKAAQSPTFLLAVILIAGLFVRLWSIWEYQFNPDEMEFLIIAKGETLAEVWRRGLAELHPPLTHFLRHYLLGFGDDALIQRLFSIAAGMVSILGMYQFGLKLRGTLCGLLCAGCMALLPVAVSSSMTIRDYAFFMGFLSWALVFFVRWQDQHRQKDLVYFTLLIFLASATNFSGFLAAAICGISEGIGLLRAKRYQTLTVFCLSYLPLLMLAVFFYPHYLAPGAAIPTWSTFINEANPATSIWMGIFSYFIPFLNLLKHKDLGGPGVASFLVLATGITLIGLQILGMTRMRKQSPGIFSLVLTAWMVTLAASAAHLYPFSGTRHTYYFLPFFLLPFWFVLEPVANKIFDRRHALAIAIVLVAVFIKQSHYYEWYGEEFSLKHKDFNDGQAFLSSHLQPGDAIVASRVAAYFYMLYAKDGGKIPYDAYADVPYYNKTLVLAPYDAPSHPYNSWHPFHDSLQSRLSMHGKIWFVMYGAKNTEIWHLMECPTIQPDIRDFFSRDNVMIFSIKAAPLAAFLKNTAAWERCYADYKPLITAEMFPEVAAPSRGN